MAQHVRFRAIVSPHIGDPCGHIDFGVGVNPVATYQVQKIDSDYFTDI
jgi:hypothetical protein